MTSKTTKKFSPEVRERAARTERNTVSTSASDRRKTWARLRVLA